ncbi:chemotaxis protein CheB [Caballeronia sp. LZ001]|uniref:chemotaxis protein CheB n=1 Tax=Caballeronia sp. LZ001 TaxID=3038553 RepID=UPI0028628971|nr:chemotaxis protein CheB [Caballeronia sp. LZ001]MDR5806469.1 CheR family methyltransferase [Caballeronia sp. LZ001]
MLIRAKSGQGSHGPDFPVVGIGASAGGVQALLQLFEVAPNTTGVAFVVVMHLSPDHTSHAHEVIQNVTRLRVRQVASPVPLEKDTVYVIPPGKLLSMVDGYLRISEPELPRLPPTSIDVFFRSLAEAHGSRAIAVILSGTGSDGSVGISRVRERGGVTLAQLPEEAQYGDMPRSAIATGAIDLVLPVAQVITTVLELARNAAQIVLPTPSDALPESPSPQPTTADDAIDEVLKVLRVRTRHNFAGYKRGTVVRRIERRMQVARTPTVAAYRAYLEANTEETPKLLADMLIGVTQFFRDPQSFAGLEQSVLPQLLVNLKGRDEVRAWVPACSTGEEAYSLAILLDEAVRRLPHRPRVSVYASDIDERAIGVARAATYPQAIENDVSPERLSQYFNKEGSRYRLCKALRDTVIFAAHNLLRDPPFSRLDLVSCRNVLIYLDRRAQSHVLETLHFALKPHHGFLFLGTAESAEFAGELFTPVDKHQRIYRARPDAVGRGLSTLGDVSAPFHFGPGSLQSSGASRALDEGTRPSEARAHGLYGPPLVAACIDGTIVHRSMSANRLTEKPDHSRAANILDVVRADAQARLKLAIERCFATSQRQEEVSVPFATASGELLADLSLRRYRDLSHQEFLVSITCDVLTALADDGSERTQATDPEQGDTIDSLREALEGSESLLHHSVQLERSSGEALRASNEELQAMNEELRSATEELEASREELQSLNEELMTVNAELLLKVQESSRVSDDLKNLISSVGVATVFVDRMLRIKRYTSPAETLFNIRSGDEGRPLRDLTHNLEYPELVNDLRGAFESLKRSEREVYGHDGRVFLARVLPYLTDDNRIDGAVLALIDISEQKTAQNQARASEEKLRLAARETHDFAIIVLDDDGIIVSWNVGAARMFGFAPDEMLGQPLDSIFTPEDIAEGVPSQERHTAATRGRAEDERWHACKDGRRIFCSGFLSRVQAPGFSGFTKIVHDATSRKLAESRKERVLERERADNTEVRKLSRLKDEFIAVLSHELKNPLNLIFMKSEILIRTPEAKTSARIQDVASTIQKSVLAQAQIIDDLLDFSRIQTGKLSLRFTPVDITGIIRTIADAMRDDFHTSNVGLQLDIPSTPVLIHADPVRLEQIVWNLLSNALKFTPSDGQVAVRLNLEAGRMRLEVADTGCGIERDAIASVFNIFEQTPNKPYRTRPGGLGIGLSLVQQIAQLHGGTAEAFSDGAGRGARFIVSLPADGSLANRQAGDKSADLSVFVDAHILIVEDSKESLDAMAELLTLHGARVETASKAADALAIANQVSLDAVVTDVGLPDMDGYRLAAQLRTLKGLSNILIVAVTGRPVSQDADIAREAGCDELLSKPFNLKALADAIRAKRR